MVEGRLVVLGGEFQPQHGHEERFVAAFLAPSHLPQLRFGDPGALGVAGEVVLHDIPGEPLVSRFKSDYILARQGSELDIKSIASGHYRVFVKFYDLPNSLRRVYPGGIPAPRFMADLFPLYVFYEKL